MGGLVGVLALSGCGLVRSVGDSDEVVTRPRLSKALFANPGMGWETFHGPGFPEDAVPSSVLYFRFYWDEFEPEEGRYDYGLLDRYFRLAAASGQRVAFRLMIESDNGHGGPPWLRGKGRGRWFVKSGHRAWSPDLDDPKVFGYVERLVRVVGLRYGRSPELDHVDIGLVGLWGEWHFSGCEPDLSLPSAETRRRIVDLHFESFPEVPKLMLINDPQTLAYAVGRGAGWRADCLGDLGIFSPHWNHHEHMYPVHLRQAAAEEAWQRAPVAFEPCGTVQDWLRSGYDPEAIFRYALDLHVSYFNNKNRQPPPEARRAWEAFARRMGYRLAVVRVAHPAVAVPGQTVRLTLVWTNAGVAPCYLPFRTAVRIVGDGGPVVVLTGGDVRTLLPGSRTEVHEAVIPAGVKAPEEGWSVEVAVVDAGGGPRVRLALEAARKAEWTPVARIGAAAGREADGDDHQGW